MTAPLDLDEWRRMTLMKKLKDAPPSVFGQPPSPQAEQTETKTEEPKADDPSVALPAQSPHLHSNTLQPYTAVQDPNQWQPDESLPIEEQGFDPIFGFDNLVDIYYYLYPNGERLYQWQAEELYRLSGYVSGRPTGQRIHWFRNQPILTAYCCANGSGKDCKLNATAAIGLPLLYRDTFVVATSSSDDQLSHQTEAHIKHGIEILNARLAAAGCPPLYHSIHHYHSCPSRGGEIKLFATDEAGRAEGWHPRTSIGRLVLIINEAKSITPVIFSALDRCSGYSHWMEISSPGPRRGLFYSNFKNCKRLEDGHEPRPFEFFGRRISYKLCPHKSEEERNVAVRKHGENSFIVKTSFDAEFWEEATDVIIPYVLIEDCDTVRPIESPVQIGIGLDCAAGGDETVLCVRKNNKLIDLYAFKEPNTETAVAMIDQRLDIYRKLSYTFNADNGGVGRGMLDKLTSLGWRILKRHNQSAAYTKSRFLNLGAEIYWHTRELFEARKIVAPKDEKLRIQLASRKRDVQEGQGKLKLQSKQLVRAEGSESPDRADAFTLCFFSYRPGFSISPQQPQQDPHEEASSRPAMSFAQLAALLRRNPNGLSPLQTVKEPGSYTLQRY